MKPVCLFSPKNITWTEVIAVKADASIAPMGLIRMKIKIRCKILEKERKDCNGSEIRRIKIFRETSSRIVVEDLQKPIFYLNRIAFTG